MASYEKETEKKKRSSIPNSSVHEQLQEFTQMNVTKLEQTRRSLNQTEMALESQRESLAMIEGPHYPIELSK